MQKRVILFGILLILFSLSFASADDFGGWLKKVLTPPQLSSPTGSCSWPPDPSITNTQGTYTGKANSNSLFLITAPNGGSYTDETLLCYEGKIYAAVDGWSYWNYNANTRPWGIVVKNLGQQIGDWKVVEDSYWGKKWILIQPQGQITNVKVEQHVCEGYIDVICSTDNINNIVEPINAFSYTKFDFFAGEGHGVNGKQVIVYRFVIDKSLSGTYKIGCKLVSYKPSYSVLKEMSDNYFIGACTNQICTDECTEGDTRCDGNFQQTCGDYNPGDSDYCLKWGGGGIIYCQNGCENDECIFKEANPGCGNGILDTGEFCDTALQIKCEDYELNKIDSNIIKDGICWGCKSASFSNCEFFKGEKEVKEIKFWDKEILLNLISFNQMDNTIHIWFKKSSVWAGSKGLPENELYLLSSNDGLNFKLKEKIKLPYNLNKTSYIDVDSISTEIKISDKKNSLYVVESLVEKEGETSNRNVVYTISYSFWKGWYIEDKKILSDNEEIPVPTETDLIVGANQIKISQNFEKTPLDGSLNQITFLNYIAELKDKDSGKIFFNESQLRYDYRGYPEEHPKTPFSEPINDKFFKYEILNKYSQEKSGAYKIKQTLKIYELNAS